MSKSEVAIIGVFLYFVTICVFYGAYLENTQNSYERGYDNGFIVGENSGYENGYSAGYGDGYDNGYVLGLYVGQPFKDGVRNPTHREMMDFIEHDNTDQHGYIPKEYECINFSRDVWNHATAENIRCAMVTIHIVNENENTHHGLVAFETIDRGLVYIEPQSDTEMDVYVGGSYWSYVVEDFWLRWNDVAN